MNPLVSPQGYAYTGNPGAVQQPCPGVRYSPQTGRIEAQRWEGAPDDIAALEAALQADGISYRIPPGQTGGFRTIDIDEPTPDTASGQLYQTDDLIGQDPEKDLLQHPGLDGVPPGAVAALAATIGQYDSGQTDYTDALIDLTTAEVDFGLPIGKLQDYFELHKRGIRSFAQSTYIIRRTAIYAPGAPVQVITNVDKHYETSGDLEAAENIDPNRIWQIPAGMWLKKTPQFQRQRNGTTTFTVEWWWAKQWSSVLYPVAT